MKTWKKLAFTTAALATAGTLSACSSSKSISSTSNKNRLTLWVDAGQVPYYKTAVKDLEKSRKGVKVRVTQSPNGLASAKTDAGKDPGKAADVFEVPNNQLDQVAEAGYVNPLPPSDIKDIKDNYIGIAYKGVGWKNKVYAYPCAQQAQTVYYNKSKLSKNGIENWDTLISKGAVTTDPTNAYTMWSVFFSVGTKLFGDNGETLKGSTLNLQGGADVLTWSAEQKKDRDVIQTPNTLNRLRKGKVVAASDDPWNATDIKKILSKNLAVAKHPIITVGSKKVRMEAFLGIEGFAINSHTASAKAGVQLAVYITNKGAQLIAYDKTGQTPILKAAINSSDVKSDNAAEAVTGMAKPGNSVLIPKTTQMATSQDGAVPLISGAYDGRIKPTRYKAQLGKLVKETEKKWQSLNEKVD